MLPPFLKILVCLQLLAAAPAAPATPSLASEPRAAPTDEFHLQWVREYPALKPAWPDQPMLQFDAAYGVTVQASTLFVNSPRDDSVIALDAATGAEQWRFVTDGPVRFAPLGWEGNLYFVADDGYLYCLDATNGMLRWKFRGGPSERKILGNERLISTWPARGAPVIADGTVYFAASIWPFMGVFIHALDARSGQVIWTNSGDGSVYMKQPHMADSFAGVAPQGRLVVVGDKLLVPGGRSVPACYDRKTGKLLHYRLADNGHRGGGDEVAGSGNVFVNGGEAFALDSGDYLGTVGSPWLLGDNILFGCGNGQCHAYDLKNLQPIDGYDRKGGTVQRTPWPPPLIGSAALSDVATLAQAEGRLLVGGRNRVAAVALPLPDGKPAVVIWEAAIEGKVVRLLAADGRLLVVTLEGRIYCFGKERVEPRAHPRRMAPAMVADVWTAKARAILDTTHVHAGYCVVWGTGSGRLVTELARQSQLHLIVIDPDPHRVEALRRDLVAAGLYGERIAVHVGDPLTFPLPPYLASLMVSEDLHAAGIELQTAFVTKAFQVLRPYGGVVCLPLTRTERHDLDQAVADAHLANARVRDAGDWVLLSREGALPGSADWTHEHADAANTRVSNDQLVMAPLGILWFGGTSHDGILPRHGHGPQPQVIDGRLIIEGADLLRAMDVYTGRMLWETALPGVGKYFDNTSHQPGANASGTNYISTTDGIYVLYGRVCLRLDPADGHKLAEFALPVLQGAQDAPAWDYLTVIDDTLIGGTSGSAERSGGTTSSMLGPQSSALVALDRHSGAVRWSVTAHSSFRHNAICAGGGRLYCIDRLAPEQLAHYRRRGETPPTAGRLVAFDLQTGQEVWSTEHDVFGTWLSYSAKHDVLVESGRVARDTLTDEPDGMRAYRAASGAVLWYQKNFDGPAMIHGDTILKDRSACDLLTGAPVMRAHPLTGEQVEWTWTRSYGCNTPAASEHLLTFRSGAAGYFDLGHDGGTGNLGGFRSSCTNNLIVADGLLNAPDYTRTCTCTYQNQTSLALVHMPEAEMWTYFGALDVKGPVQRAGVHFGAPGCRRADNGTLWLEYPHVGGPEPALRVSTVPSNPECFRKHASQIEGGNWLAASGAKGLNSVTIELGGPNDAERLYTVRLYFVEPEGLKPGQRVFSVALQGREVLKDFDIVKEAGAPDRGLVREFKSVKVGKELTVKLTSTSDQVPVLCGVEVLAATH